MPVTRVPVEGVLFDCDGVLADSHESAAGPWDIWAARFAPGFDFRTRYPAGMRAVDAIAQLVTPEVLDEAVADLAVEELRSAATTGPIPGSVELASRIPVERQPVVTSGNRSLAEARLSAAGHLLPDAMVTGDDVEHGKPNGEPYSRGADLLGVAASHCVAFENAPAGVASARAAGIGYIIGVGQELNNVVVDARVADLTAARYAQNATGGELLIGSDLARPSALAGPPSPATHMIEE